MHISGNLGELIATNYNNMTFEKFSDFVNDVGYFIGKINCLSRDIFYYDEYKARNDLKKLIEEYEIEEKLMLDRYDFETIDDVIDDILIDFSEETGIGSNGYDELSKGFYDAYDVWEVADVREVASNAGKESTGILDLYMLAFKLAIQQLKEEVKDDEYKEELMKELLNRYEQRKSIQNQCTLFILDNYIEKLERKLKELL